MTRFELPHEPICLSSESLEISSECGLGTYHECASTVLNWSCFCSAALLTDFIPIVVEKKNR